MTWIFKPFSKAFVGLMSAHYVLIPPPTVLAHAPHVPYAVHFAGVHNLQATCGDDANACSARPWVKGVPMASHIPWISGRWYCVITMPEPWRVTALTENAGRVMPMSEWREIFWHELAHCRGWRHYPDAGISTIDGNG